MSGKLCGILHLDSVDWDMLGCDSLLAAGVKARGLSSFEKIDDAAVQAQIDKLNRAKGGQRFGNAWKPEPQSADVDIDTFGRCDIGWALCLSVSVCRKPTNCCSSLLTAAPVRPVQ